MKLTGINRSTWKKTCSRATMSTTDPIWTDPGSNPSLRRQRPATNGLSHGTASAPLVCRLSTRVYVRFGVTVELQQPLINLLKPSGNFTYDQA
jgi:hypothetical protein